MSSESGQGEDRRSWWEKPDPDDQATRDPYASGPHASDAETTAVPSDVGDPYRQAPTQSVPQYSGEDQGWSSPREDAHPPQWGGPAPQQDYPPLSGSTPQPGQQPPPLQYGQPQPYGQPYPQPAPGYNQTYADTAGRPSAPPVAGAAHGVLWTAVGGLVLLGTGLGWIAAIVALALTPGARRTVLESRGTRSGLGYLLAGKVIAWTTIGLTVLIVLALALVFGLLVAGRGMSGDYWYDSVTGDTTTTVLATVARA